MITGALEIQLLAEVARLRTDMAEAKRIVGDAASTFEKHASTMRSVFQTLGIGISAGAFIAFAKSVIDSADALNKMSQKVGIAVGDLSQLKYAAQLSDVSVESLGKGMKGLAQKITEANDPASKAGQIMKALGVDIKAGASPAIDKIANAFASLPDGTTKATLAVEVFGKAGMDMIPLLNQGAAGIRAMKDEAQRLGLTLTDETAKAAEAFNDNLTAVKSASTGAGIAIFNDLSPAMVRITKAMKEAAEESGMLKAVWIAMGGIASESLGLNATETESLTRNLRRAQAEVAKFGGELTALRRKELLDGVVMPGNMIEASFIRANFQARLTKETLDAIAGKYGDQVSRSQQQGKGAAGGVDSALEARIKGLLATSKAADAAAKSMKELGLADAHVIAFLKQEAELHAAVAKAIAEGEDARRKKIDSIEEEIRRQEFQNDTLGMTREQIALLTVARLEEQMAILKASGAMETDLAQLQEEIDLRKKLAGLIGDGERGREAMRRGTEDLQQQSRIWNDLATAAGDFFADLVMNGKSAFDNLKKWVKDLLAQMIALFAKRWILNMAAGGSVSGAFGSALSETGSGSMGGTIIGAAGNYLAGAAGFTGLGTWSTFAGAASGSIPAAAIGAGAVEAGVGVNTFAASFGSQLSGVYTALANIPVWGWIAMAVIAIGAWIAGKHKGGPKVGGSFMGGFDETGAFTGTTYVPGSDNGRFFTPNQGDDVVKGLVEGVGKGFFDTLKKLGGTSGGFNFGLGFDHDPQGTAASRVSALLTDSKGNVLYSALDRSMDDKEVDAALQLEAQRMLLVALQNSELPEEVSKILNSVVAAGATSEDIQKVIAAAIEMKQVIDGLAQLNIKGLDVKALQAFQLDGETIGQTFQRVAGAWSQFIDLFYTDAEKIAMVQDQVAAVFADLGIAIPTSNEEFRKLVESLDLSTESGRKMFAALMGVAPAFNTITNAAAAAVTRFNTLAATLSPSFGASNAKSVLEARVRAWMGLSPSNSEGWTVESTIDNIGRMIREGRIGDALTYAQSLGGNAVTILNDMLEAYIAWTTAMENASGPVRDVGAGISGLGDAATRAAEQMQGAKDGLWAYLQSLLVNPHLSPLDPMQQLGIAKGQFYDQLALARGGDLGAAQGLSGFIDTILNLGRGVYASGSGYVDLFNEITGAAGDFARPGGGDELQRGIYSEAVTSNDLLRDVKALLLDIRDGGTADGEQVAGAVMSAGLESKRR